MWYATNSVDAMTEVTTTVQMDKRGRLVVPKPVRESLDIDGESANLEIDVEVADER